MEREWLRQMRKIKGYKQEDVAKYAKKSITLYSYIESGERNPSVKTAQRIADLLNFDWTLFFPEEKKKNKNKEV